MPRRVQLSENLDLSLISDCLRPKPDAHLHHHVAPPRTPDAFVRQFLRKPAKVNQTLTRRLRDIINSEAGQKRAQLMSRLISVNGRHRADMYLGLAFRRRSVAMKPSTPPRSFTDVSCQRVGDKSITRAPGAQSAPPNAKISTSARSNEREGSVTLTVTQLHTALVAAYSQNQRVVAPPAGFSPAWMSTMSQAPRC
jgi:hypothetical protein